MGGDDKINRLRITGFPMEHWKRGSNLVYGRWSVLFGQFVLRGAILIEQAPFQNNRIQVVPRLTASR